MPRQKHSTTLKIVGYTLLGNPVYENVRPTKCWKPPGDYPVKEGKKPAKRKRAKVEQGEK